MTTDKQALREAAEKAGKDEWQARKINGDFYVIRSGSYKKQYGITLYQSVAEIDDKAVRDFVAMANPAAVLALLDEVETTAHTAAVDHEAACSLVEENEEVKRMLADAEKRIAELEAKLANPVLLPKTNGYWTEQEKAYEEAITLAKRQVRLAGFRCEGDE
ncbi:ead/Ea22-like family protein [Salmonella enterica]|nr:ead/Ea22-like family protein [Salmonella enterica]